MRVKGVIAHFHYKKQAIRPYASDVVCRHI